MFRSWAHGRVGCLLPPLLTWFGLRRRSREGYKAIALSFLSTPVLTLLSVPVLVDPALIHQCSIYKANRSTRFSLNHRFATRNQQVLLNTSIITGWVVISLDPPHPGNKRSISLCPEVSPVLTLLVLTPYLTGPSLIRPNRTRSFFPPGLSHGASERSCFFFGWTKMRSCRKQLKACLASKTCRRK